MPKKPILSPEEKKALQLQKKLDKKRRAAERKIQLKRDYLDREVKYGSFTIRKYEKDWREMLKRIALPRMREELEFGWHNFERVIDAKDFIISLLMDELEYSEEQYMANFKNHLENIDKLMLIFHNRCQELKRDFFTDVNGLKSLGNRENQIVKSNCDDSSEYLKTMLYGLEMARKKQDRIIRAEYYSKLDEVEVKWQLLVQKLRIALEAKYQAIFDKTSEFIVEYNKHIKDRKKEYAALKEQEDHLQTLIASQFQKLKKCSDTTRLLRNQYNDMRQIEGNRILDLQAEKQYFHNTFIQLRTTMEKNGLDDHHKMIEMSSYSNGCIEHLERIIRKGEALLKITSICRKLETIKEKILPFPDRSKGILGADEDKGVIEELVAEMGLQHKLHLFWQKTGQASQLYYTLNREKQFLLDENYVFADKYKDYVENEKGPLNFVVRKKGTETVPAVDGTLTMEGYGKQFNEGLPD